MTRHAIRSVTIDIEYREEEDYSADRIVDLVYKLAEVFATRQLSQEPMCGLINTGAADESIIYGVIEGAYFSAVHPYVRDTLPFVPLRDDQDNASGKIARLGDALRSQGFFDPPASLGGAEASADDASAPLLSQDAQVEYDSLTPFFRR